MSEYYDIETYELYKGLVSVSTVSWSLTGTYLKWVHTLCCTALYSSVVTLCIWNVDLPQSCFLLD